MKFSNEELIGLTAIAKSIDVPFEAFLAVIDVESNGIPGEVISGKLEPLIRYEGHYFDKLCAAGVRDEARRAGVSSPQAGEIKNPAKQIDRWALVRKAAKYDRDAAYASCSYGVGQVMGSHWKTLGFTSLDQFINTARSGLIGQAKIMAMFIKTFNLDDELRALDWSGFARGYNGKNYKKNKYDTKMAAAYKRYGGVGTIGTKRANMLRLGSKGKDVRELQALLNKSGYTLVVDGDFGESTKQVVMKFQSERGLEVDGVVGPATQAALASVRAISPKDVGQEPALENKGVQTGLGGAIATPTIIETIKEPLGKALDQVKDVSMLSTFADYLQTALSIISVTGIVIGVSYAGYAWYKSRKTDSGTKPDPEVKIEPPFEGDLVI